MDWVRFGTALCLSVMALMVIAFTIRLIRQDGEGRLRILKSFKRGKFTFLLLIAIPLFWIGLCASGRNVGTGFLYAVESALELFVLRSSYDKIALLMTQDPFYFATMTVLYVLAYFNAILFVLSVLGQGLINAFRLVRARFSRKTYVLLGYNERNLEIARSAVTDRACAVVLSDADAAGREEIFLTGAVYVRFKKGGNAAEYIGKLAGRFDRRDVNVIVNYGDDAQNLIAVADLSRLIRQESLEKLSIVETAGLDVYVFGAPEDESVFSKYVAETAGCIHVLNKYKLIAADFWNRYPMTRFMNAETLNYETATVRESVDLNAVMIGFGATNRELFLTGVPVNQFLTIRDGRRIQKNVRYALFDRNGSEHDKNLNHTYFRYRNEFGKMSSCERDYLPLPEEPAQVEFYREDINDAEFYPTLKGILRPDSARRSISYIVVAFGTDLENLDLAEKLYAKTREWGADRDTAVFVKIRDSGLGDAVASEARLIAFGGEKELVYSVQTIVSDSFMKMAVGRHILYAAEDKIKSESRLSRTDAQEYVEPAELPGRDELLWAAQKKWYMDWKPIQREANIYACLALRQKLQLLGFDYMSETEPGEDESQAYLEQYTEGDPIEADRRFLRYPGLQKPIVRYDNAMQERDTVRRTLAELEHMRWNAYMICSGVIPAKISEIRERNHGKDFEKRKHGNLTTFEGLKEFRKIVAEATGCDEESADVIRYDYQMMDDAVWLLHAGGYKIVRKKETLSAD